MIHFLALLGVLSISFSAVFIRLAPFAAEWAVNVWPDLYDGLVNKVAVNIEIQPDEESQAYWQAVYDALTQ